MASGKATSRQSNYSGYLYDGFACDWFERLSNAREKTILDYIKKHGEPSNHDEWMAVNWRKEGHLGLKINSYARRENKGRLIISYSFFLDKHKFKRWFTDHKYMMEGILTFRLGPLVVAHPGRGQAIERPNKKPFYPPIKMEDTEFGFYGKEEVEWIGLMNHVSSLLVQCWRNPNGSNPKWMVYRAK